MDDSQKRQSALPRPSKLPVGRTSGIPKPASSIPRPGSTTSVASSPFRTTDGRSSVAGGAATTSKLRTPAPPSQAKPNLSYGDTRASRLRNSSSREQLKSYNARPSPAKSKLQGPAIARTTRVPSASTARRESSISSFTPPEETEEVEEPESPDKPNDPSAVEVEGNLSGPSPTEEAFPTGTPIPKTRSLRPRPSLSERTMETLAHVPSSPALRKQSSAFFEQATSPSRTASGTSRPGSQQGSIADTEENGPATSVRAPATNYKSSLSTIEGTPRRASGLFGAKPTKTPSRMSLGLGTDPVSTIEPRSPSPEKKAAGPQTPKLKSKTTTARPAAKRAAPKVISKKASFTVPVADTEAAESGWDGSITPLAPKQSKPLVEEEPPSASRKSSSALREQIAAAKAAKKAALKQNRDQEQTLNEVPIVPADDGFDFGVAHDDPFNLNQGAETSQKVLHQRIITARSSGRLNIAAMNLKEIPDDVMKMYELESAGGNGSWAEAVDVTRFVAADNQLETLSDAVFPDKDPQSYAMHNDEEQGNIFGGLETIDLHGNILISVPTGLRRLHLVTSLNLVSIQVSCRLT